MKNLEETDTCNDNKKRVVFAGQIDHGKSTIIGRLLVDSGTIQKEKVDFVKKLCAENKQEFKYEYLVDALASEKVAHITINCARVFLRYNGHIYTILDTPGHLEFLNSMITGVAQAEIAVFVEDAEVGLTENAKVHLLLLKILGVKKVIAAINKMDIICFEQKRYQGIVDELKRYAGDIGLNLCTFVPVSGINGDNIYIYSTNMPWYEGKSLIQLLESHYLQKQEEEKQSFRMLLQDCYIWNKEAPVYVGKVLSGEIDVGETVICLPTKSINKITRLLGCKGDVDKISSGMSVAIYFEETTTIGRGELLCTNRVPVPVVTNNLYATVYWCVKLPKAVGITFELRIGTLSVKANLKQIYKLLYESESWGGNYYVLINKCQFELEASIAIDYNIWECKSFLILIDKKICGGGMMYEE